MVIIFKKAGLIAVLIVIFTMVSIGVMIKSAPAASKNVKIDKKSVIVIDPGHGGADGGASSTAGICEKEYNLAIAKKLTALFTKYKIKTVMTREDDDITLTYPEDQTPLERKRADLVYRKELPKIKKADLLLTIHMNKFSDSSIRGAQVFYDTKFHESKEIALSIQNEFTHVLDPTNKRLSKPVDSSIYLLKNPHVPSVLIECGFLSNPQEEAKLRTKKYQNKIALCIYSGILKYLDTTDKASKKTTIVFAPF
jgi:N-acetylmuramoyl-L-alanine amidase